MSLPVQKASVGFHVFRHHSTCANHGTGADADTSSDRHAVADPDVMSDGDPVIFAPPEKIVVILSQPISLGPVDRVVLSRAPCGVVAGVDAGGISDGTKLANRRPNNVALLGDVGKIAHLDVLHDGAFADFCPWTKLTIGDCCFGVDGWVFGQGFLGTGAAHVGVSNLVSSWAM